MPLRGAGLPPAPARDPGTAPGPGKTASEIEESNCATKPSPRYRPPAERQRQQQVTGRCNTISLALIRTSIPTLLEVSFSTAAEIWAAVGGALSINNFQGTHKFMVPCEPNTSLTSTTLASGLRCLHSIKHQQDQFSCAKSHGQTLFKSIRVRNQFHNASYLYQRLCSPVSTPVKNFKKIQVIAKVKSET